MCCMLIKDVEESEKTSIEMSPMPYSEGGAGEKEKEDSEAIQSASVTVDVGEEMRHLYFQPEYNFLQVCIVHRVKQRVVQNYRRTQLTCDHVS